MKNPMTPSPRAKALLVALASLGIIAATASAQTVSWLPAGSGDWNVGTNWSGGSVPTAADDARINQGEAVLSGTGLASEIQIDLSGGGGSVRLESGAALDVGTNLDLYESGTFVQNGGITNVGNFVRFRAPGTSLTISDGTFTSTDKVYVALAGTTDKSQTLTVDGGTFVSNSNLVLARNGTSGVLEVSGGSVDINGFISIEGTSSNLGEVRVNGSAASSIDISVDILAGTLDTMAFSLDSGGITPITLGDDAFLSGVGFEFDTIAGFSASIGDTFELIDAVDGVVIDASPTVTNLGGYTFDVSTVPDGAGTDLIATVTAIPEPASGGLALGLGGIALALLSRRRRS